MRLVASRIVTDVSHVARIKHRSHFARQARYLVRLDRDTCCSAHCNDVSYVTKITHASLSAWQAQFLVRLEGDNCCPAHK